ncbi:FAD-binding domain-containing protein [Gloeopeniophorella convolvens]|nr:FAD-binding domain-containing protein [Gloeopeniophorella convolvens]
MLSPTFVVTAFSLVSLVQGYAVAPDKRSSSPYLSTCQRIAKSISSASAVFYSNSTQYIADNDHSFVSSSAPSACSVEPGTAQDVSTIIRILGSTRTPFGVKGGGHASNPGFSSTLGVQIAMTRLNQVTINKASNTIDLGPGLTWDQAYNILAPSGLNVVGGRVPTVGVAGVTLGGGYAFMSSEYGYTIDNMAGYELVLPNGTITNVTSKNKDLWFALRGGGNNYVSGGLIDLQGIVTKFSFKSIPQGQVWGGTRNYTADALPALKDALVKFQLKQKTDTKASSVISFVYTPQGIITSAVLYYHAPTPANGIFDDFLAIPTNQTDVGTRSFSDMVNSIGFINVPSGLRGYYNGVPVLEYSANVIDTIFNQTQALGDELSKLDSNFLFATALETFGQGLPTHGSDSAWPPNRSHAFFPTAVTMGYRNASLDDTITRAVLKYSSAVQAAAIKDGQDVKNAPVYPNYAIFDVTVQNMYAQNLPRLRAIQNAVDPKNVMGLAGGFKL